MQDLINQIHLYGEVLQRPTTSQEHLESLEELRDLEAQLRQEKQGK